MKNLTKISFIAALFIGIYACGNQRNTAGGATGTGEAIELAEFDETGRENFEAFYVRFSRDSVFQLQRIDFPLAVITEWSYGLGLPPNLWAKEDWTVQRELGALDSTIRQSIEPMGNNMYSEHIYINKMFYMRRDFTYDETLKQWRLHYFMDMQELSRIMDASAKPTILPTGLDSNLAKSLVTKDTMEAKD